MVLAGGAFEFGVETFPPEKVQDVQVFASPEKRHGTLAQNGGNGSLLNQAKSEG